MKYIIAAILLLGAFSLHASQDGNKTVIAKSPGIWAFALDDEQYPFVCGRNKENLSQVICKSNYVWYDCTYADPDIFFKDCVAREDIPNGVIVPAE